MSRRNGTTSMGPMARPKAGLAQLEDGIARLEVAASELRRQHRGEPIPMRLPCPSCSELHVDEGEFATKPHHTHACQRCGMVWRPAVVATVGVRFLPGFIDTEEATGA